MADYFIDPENGSDSNSGLAWNDAWKTIRHAIDGGGAPAITLPASGRTRVILRGDSVFDEVVSLNLSPSPLAPLEIVGDIDGELFGANGDPSPSRGRVAWRARSGAGVEAATTFTMANKTNVTLSKVAIFGGDAGGHRGVQGLDLNQSRDCEILDCELFAHSTAGEKTLVNVAIESGTPANVAIRRCVFYLQSGVTNGAQISPETHTSDYDAGILIESCLFINGHRGVYVIHSSGGGSRGVTNVRVQNCTVWAMGHAGAHVSSAGSPTTSSPIINISDSLFLDCDVAFRANKASEISEDYNAARSLTPRVNVPPGANTIILEDTWSDLSGFKRPGSPLTPTKGSSLLGWGFHGSGSAPALDLLGRPFDPIAPACGALERVDPSEPDPDPDPVAYKRIIDDSDGAPHYEDDGWWVSLPDPNANFNFHDGRDGTQRHAPNPDQGESATWTFDDVPAGHFKVYATWNSKSLLPGEPGEDGQASRSARYRIYDDAALVGSETIDQAHRLANEAEYPVYYDLDDEGSLWKLIGVYSIQSGTAKVVLDRDGEYGGIFADAIMLVGSDAPAPIVKKYIFQVEG